ncbi:uncharacterized protein LOC118405313 isoform X2 [Branchiostoma floridae]|uniref:Uncharacterized protein LOC118405313 isoform X2 n=1 Tax=Branchiostoma floridae TaxID=7739 RepID=A0A9J7HMK1_BRAFL|nr:uncharacterized protein LOC118405313 isoform X2 [Branchiostoma floridae]
METTLHSNDPQLYLPTEEKSRESKYEVEQGSGKLLKPELLKSYSLREILTHCHCHNFLLYSEETRTWRAPHFSEFFRTRKSSTC